ncbi:MAG: Gldg family protein [Phycisphaerae bacterium]|nr:Gldg family protein [Phycisphaerae bacterium]
MQRSGKRFIAVVAIVAVAAGLVALNTVLAFTLRSARLDLTQERLYTLSPGVKELVRNLDENVRVHLYWSESVATDLPQYRTLAERVYEFLDELAAASGGKVVLRRVDPKPFSEEEDAARAAGLAVQPVDGTGKSLTLGVVIEGPTDKVEVIPTIGPEDESLLEYEIARRIVSVARGSKPVVAVLSSIPETPPFDPRNPAARGGPPLIIEQLRALFDVRYVDLPADVPPILPEGTSALILVQPRDWSEATLRTIDAWAVAGKPILALVDPWCETDPSVRANAGGAPAGTTFNLGALLASWGIELAGDAGVNGGAPVPLVVGDETFATRVQARSQAGTAMQLAYLPWLSLTKGSLVKDDPIAGSLNAINIMSAGSIRKTPSATTTVSPILVSTERSELIPTMKLGLFGQPDQLLKDFKPSGQKQWLAVRVSGPITSAFPAADGAPASGNANIVVIADADFLQNDTWVQEQRIGGQTVGYSAFADNAGLVVNAVETLAGNRTLADLRSRGEYRRPFDKVEEIRRTAEANYLLEEERLQREIEETQRRISQLQRDRGGGTNALVLSPEQQAELRKLEASVADARKKLRAVQHTLREDVDRLGRRVMLANVVLWPLIVAGIALVWVVGRYQRQRPAAPRAGGAT